MNEVEQAMERVAAMRRSVHEAEVRLDSLRAVQYAAEDELHAARERELRRWREELAQRA
jgi:hypothetical protein